MHMLGPEGITSDRITRHNIREHSADGGAHAEGHSPGLAHKTAERTAALAMLGIEERYDTPAHRDDHDHGQTTTSEDVVFKAEDNSGACSLSTGRNWWRLLTSNPSTCVTAQRVGREGRSTLMQLIPHPAHTWSPVVIGNDVTACLHVCHRSDFSPPPGLDCTALFARQQLRGCMSLLEAVECIGVLTGLICAMYRLSMIQFFFFAGVFSSHFVSLSRHICAATSSPSGRTSREVSGGDLSVHTGFCVCIPTFAAQYGHRRCVRSQKSTARQNRYSPQWS